MSCLREQKATPEEVAAAKKILEANGDKDAQKRLLKSAQVNMKTWSGRDKKVSKEDAAIISGSRGADRFDLTVLYLVHQIRAKKGVAKTSLVVADDDVEENAEHEWGEEEMDKEIGYHRATHLRASGKIKSIPCGLTQSTDRYDVL